MCAVCMYENKCDTKLPSTIRLRKKKQSGTN